MDSTCGAGQTGEPQSSERYEGDGDNVIDSCKWKKKQTFRKYMKHSACNITVSSNESCHYIKGIARDAFFKVISSLHVTLLTSSYSYIFISPLGKKKKKKKKKNNTQELKLGRKRGRWSFPTSSLPFFPPMFPIYRCKQMAQRNNGTAAKWQNGTMAQRHNGTTAKWQKKNMQLFMFAQPYFNFFTSQIFSFLQDPQTVRPIRKLEKNITKIKTVGTQTYT
ncbi:conserved Plasmodium protein, unknown function [Plasmodium ovale wallikeri]|uniref:Uncharacterized protein n=1 Tax=Plasmodium ovale wallikeri TaxID=864142 RepID=A0A1A8YG92_PLAOA|nr:conserved Plasmodium protein, unknown function [Plasmodium ovale wallikeri]